MAGEEGDRVDALDAWPSEGFRQPQSDRMIWDWWTDYANAALRAFPMYVDFAGNAGSGASPQRPTRLQSFR